MFLVVSAGLSLALSFLAAETDTCAHPQITSSPRFASSCKPSLYQEQIEVPHCSQASYYLRAISMLVFLRILKSMLYA